MRMRLSQSHLTMLDLCPRKFQYTYLDQYGTPISPDQQLRFEWGNQFHLLMQQRELELPIDYAVPNDERHLLQHVGALVDGAPDLFQVQPGRIRQSEHRRSLTVQDYLLTVIYDLVVLDDQQAQIVDWKTYPKPQNRHHLEHHWQTKLYPFVLAETSDYAPEQISMTYWFVQAGRDQIPRPQHLRFGYSIAQHEQIRHELTGKLSQLTEWLERDHRTASFQKVDDALGVCERCSFAIRCQRGEFSPSTRDERLPPVSEIQEVIL
ncbi:MAG: PD-(D/E)XK nuclease family protein [Elainellaceae cyanobacterium]